MAVAGLKNLCAPSKLYLGISFVFMILVLFQNYSNVNTYCLGSYTCNVSSTALIFIIKVIYILFWTWILNLICQAGASGVAWFLVLVPFILLFILLSLLMLY
jgi:hypothetical protein